jgi:hypothetical protein
MTYKQYKIKHMEILILLLWAGGLYLYFLPSLLGYKKQDKVFIFLVNFLLGWTVIAWIFCLIWATSKDNKSEQASTK